MGSALGGPPAEEKVLNHGDIADVIPGFCSPVVEGQATFNNLHAVAIRGSLDESRLRTALNELQLRHPRLRAKYYENPFTKYNYLLESDQEIPIYVRDGSYGTINLDLEAALLNEIDFFDGPFCHVTYVLHRGKDTGLLIFGNSHGVGDGRSCEIALSQLLRLYNGDDVAFHDNVTSSMQLKYRTAGTSCFSGGDPVDPQKLRRWRHIESEFPKKEVNAINETLVDPRDNTFTPHFEGVCIEILRLSEEETISLTKACRAAGTTVTGAAAAAVQYAIIKELNARGRSTDVMSIGIDMDQRRFLQGMGDELGNFVSDACMHTNVSTDFWEVARQVRRFISRVLEENVGFESTVIGMGGLSRDRLMMMRQMKPSLTAAISCEIEHANLSSLGVLTRFAKYKDFKVLENFTAAHMGFYGVKVNVATSGSSKRLTACTMVTRNVTADTRQLAQNLRDHIMTMLKHPPPINMESYSSGESKESARDFCDASRTMQERIKTNRVRMHSLARSVAGTTFQGDTSGASSLRTHLRLALDIVFSTLAAGPLISFPLYQPFLQDAGVFNFVCPDGEHTCDEQGATLSGLYSVSMTCMITGNIFLGYLYDLYGARGGSCLGAIIAFVCLCVIAFGVSLDARTWPITQQVLLYSCFVLADLGGGIASFGILGWMWHYPRSQALIMGLSNATYQASGCLGVLFSVMIGAGVSIESPFLLLAVFNLFSAAGLYFTVPDRKEYLSEAGRVLNRNAAAADFSSMVGWWYAKYQLKQLWILCKLYPWQNFSFIMYQGTALAAILYWISISAVEFKIWYGKEEAKEITEYYAVVVVIVGVVMNPLAGYLIEKMGFILFFGICSSITYMMFAVVWLRNSAASHILIVCVALWTGTYQTIQMKYPVFFGPPETYGIFYSGLTSLSGLIALVLTVAAGIAQPTSEALFAIPCGVLFSVATVATTAMICVLGSKGIPPTPPKDQYSFEVEDSDDDSDNSSDSLSSLSSVNSPWSC